MPDRHLHVLAILLVAALAGTVISLLIIQYRRLPYTPIQFVLFWYKEIMARVYWRTKVEGTFPLADDHGGVIVCNHRSPTDPTFISCATLRVVHWMVAREYCELPGLGWFFRAVGAIPVNRGGIDTKATKLAIRLAQQGGLVGLFPEGRLNWTDQLLLPGRPGAALIALRARVPVVPCYIQGSPFRDSIFWAFFTPARVTVRIGPPLDLSEFYGREHEKEVLEELTLRFLKEIARLAGRPDFEPQLAGRHWKPGAPTSDAVPATASPRVPQ
jgi:1-acyl-sn-glycerol-3-phosphate acyltransferase